jgi:lipopolysaccharide exporter
VTGHDLPPASSLSAAVRRGLGWSAAGTVVLRVASVAVSIVMARLLAPDEFGVFAVALTIWAILGTLTEGGLGTVVVRAVDPERRIPTVTTLGLLTSAVFGATMVVGAPALAEAFRSPESVDVIRLMALNLFLFGFCIVPSALLQRAFRQRALFAANLAAILVATTVTVLLVVLADQGAAALAWGQVAGQVVLAVGQHLLVRRWPRYGFDREVAGAALRFCAPLAGAHLLSWLLLSIDNLIVARYTSPAVLGLYVLAFNVSSWPMSAVGEALRSVALPAFAQIRDPKVRNDALVDSSSPVFAVVLLLGVGLSSMAVPVVTVLYGDRWRDAALALAGLSIFGALRVVLDLLGTFLIAVGRAVTVLLLQVWWLVVMLPAMAWAVARYGLAGAGWAHAVVAALAVLPAYLLCVRRVGVDVAAYLRGWLVPLVAVVPTALACWWCARSLASPYAALLGAALSALVLYVLPLGRWWLHRLALLKRVDRLPVPVPVP